MPISTGSKLKATAELFPTWTVALRAGAMLGRRRPAARAVARSNAGVSARKDRCIGRRFPVSFSRQSSGVRPARHVGIKLERFGRHCKAAGLAVGSVGAKPERSVAYELDARCVSDAAACSAARTPRMKALERPPT